MNWLVKASPALYILVLVAALVGSFGMKIRFRGVLACPASYESTAYISDCNAANYGDYDHGAFWYGLEPDAARAVARAKVVFLGNSRLQFAFSTPDTVRWFAHNAISFYLLGFSHNETVAYVTPLLARLEPHASVYVIHADRFFETRVSPPAAQVMYDDATRARYREKQVWQTIHAHLCGALTFLCGEALAVYRTRADGTWRTSGTLPDENSRVSDGAATNMERWPEHIELARRFIDQLHVKRECVVLTMIPTVGTRRAEAQAIADALHVPLIAPRMDQLNTFDGSHLDRASAAKWSAAFFQAAGPTIRDCARNAAASDANNRDTRAPEGS